MRCGWLPRGFIARPYAQAILGWRRSRADRIFTVVTSATISQPNVGRAIRINYGDRIGPLHLGGNRCVSEHSGSQTT